MTFYYNINHGFAAKKKAELAERKEQKEAKKVSLIISQLPMSSSTPSTEASTMTHLATSISIEINRIKRRKRL